MASITDATDRLQSHNELFSNKLASPSSGTAPVSNTHTRYLVLHSERVKTYCRMSKVTFHFITVRHQCFSDQHMGDLKCFWCILIAWQSIQSYFCPHSHYPFYILLWHILVPEVMYYTATVGFPLGAPLQCLYSFLDPFVKHVRPPLPMRLKPTFPFTHVLLDCDGWLRND